MIKIKVQENQEDNYKIMLKQAKNLLIGETDEIAALANLSALIMAYTEGINWAGFYILKGETLVLGPFQGLPACVRLELSKGVCGEAAFSGKALNVPNVHEFPGHVACDEASNSELVIPVFDLERVWGVLDLDSPRFSRFDPMTVWYMKNIAVLIGAFITELRRAKGGKGGIL